MLKRIFFHGKNDSQGEKKNNSSIDFRVPPIVDSDTRNLHLFFISVLQAFTRMIRVHLHGVGCEEVHTGLYKSRQIIILFSMDSTVDAIYVVLSLFMVFSYCHRGC